MYPHERSLVRKMADKPFAIIGVNSDGDLDKIRATSAKKNISWRSFWNGEKGTRGPISKKWQISGWPSTFLLDKDGVIRYKNLRGEALDKAIEELMEEMGEKVKLVGIDHEAEDAAAMDAAAKAEKEKPKADNAEAENEEGKTKSATKDGESKDSEAKEKDGKGEEATADAQAAKPDLEGSKCK